MPTYLAPGVFIEELNKGSRPIAGVSTSTGAFVGVSERGPVGRAVLVTGFAEFVKRFGGPLPILTNTSEHYLYYAVRHFFEGGGTRCYVVRVAHFTNINDPDTLQATTASRQFPARDVAGATVANALTVSGVSPGTWGRSIRVRVESSSKFQLTLGEPIAPGNFRSIILPRNTDVVPGTVLYLVHEITGVVSGVVADTAATNPRTVAFSDALLEGTTVSSRTLPATNVAAFKPDFSLMTVTDLAAAVDLTAPNNPPPSATAIRLATTNGLSVGDSLHFVVNHALVVVHAVEEADLGAGPVMRAFITSTGGPDIALPDLPANVTKVYARDFRLLVEVGGNVVESHPNLSLVNLHAADYVNTRLGAESGGSQYIVADDPTAISDAVVMANTAFTALTGGDNGLTNLATSDFLGSDLAKNGLRALDAVEDASILVIGYSQLTLAGETPTSLQRMLTSSVIAWVENRRDMFYVVDPPRTAGADPIGDVRTFKSALSSSYAGLYFPWIEVADQLTGMPVNVPPAGAVAGIFARSDALRGVHKAPAGIDVGRVTVASGLAHQTTRGQNDMLYPLFINVIRGLSEGIVVWGSRTMSADPLWQQVNIRRLFIFLEQSIQLGTSWVVFEPNDTPLWKSIERSVRGFLRIQWIEGKLVGVTEEQAFYVRCNAETNPPEIVDAGMVVTEIGVAPSRPAEFVVFRVFQWAGRES